MERYLTYEEVHLLLDKTAKELRDDGFIPDIIAGFCRGGMLPAVRLSHMFSSKFMPLELSTRDHSVIVPQNTVFRKISDALNDNKKVLVVDDICDSGSTYELFFSLLNITDINKHYLHNLKTFALQRRNTSSYIPNYISETLTNNDWQIYPWEV